MSIGFVFGIMQRKVKPLHPGSIVIDILEDRGINKEIFVGSNTDLKEILEGTRPITYLSAFELDLRLGIPVQLLLNLQRRLDIWDSLSE